MIEEPLKTSRVAASTITEHSIAQLEHWLQQSSPSDLPVEQIVLACHEQGKHFMSATLLKTLDRVRQRLPSYSWACTLLNTLLDKFDNRYDYRSYLALDLLLWDEAITKDEATLDWRVTILTTDLIRFEIDALDGKACWLPLMPTDQPLTAMRCRRLLRAMEALYIRVGMDYPTRISDPIQACRELHAAVAQRHTAADHRSLAFTMLPVYTNHDEYLFLRILQSFEMLFYWLSICLRQVITLGDNDINHASLILQRCAQRLKETSLLFPLLSSLRVEAFREFRAFTEGASAIQSRSYKTVESLCRRPEKERLDSIAYHSVPDIREKILNQPQTIDEFYLKLDTSNAQTTIFQQAMVAFQSELILWRQSHYGIAVKMLGMASGTGYTEGTPYLKESKNIPVFTAIHKEE
jgi:tryptophan 2,3-dioxygenase